MRDLSKHREHRAASEEGFTLPELMIVIVLMGILAAIAIPSWFGLIESRNVESAMNQIVADFRSTGSTASNRLSTWAVVLVPDKATKNEGPDYYVARLTSTGTVDTSVSPTPRYLPDDIKIVNESPLNDPPSVTALYGSATGFVQPPNESRSIKFLSDGSIQANGNVVKISGSSNSRGKITLILTTGKVGAEIAS